MSIQSPWIAAVGVGALLVGSVAVAKPTWEMTFTIGASPSTTYGRGMRWSKKPNDSEIFALYPQAAFDERLSGVALLECAATAEGKLVDCSVVEEVPEGKGFAQASLAVLDLYEFGPRHRITPEMVGKRMKVPFIWGVKKNTSREVRP